MNTSCILCIVSIIVSFYISYTHTRTIYLGPVSFRSPLSSLSLSYTQIRIQIDCKHVLKWIPYTILKSSIALFPLPPFFLPFIAIAIPQIMCTHIWAEIRTHTHTHLYYLQLTIASHLLALPRPPSAFAICPFGSNPAKIKRRSQNGQTATVFSFQCC